jgi:RNA polymerase sigma factor (sigma-70 family)
VLAANRGEDQAFEILVKRYQPKIFAIAMRFTRVREDAEDIVQETFQKAFIHLHRFEGKSSFFTWLTRIAINEALMLLRKGHLLREVSMANSTEGETVAHGLEIRDPVPDPEANYLKREATGILRSAIGKLTIGCGLRSSCGNSVSYLAKRRLDGWASLSTRLKLAYSSAEGSYARVCGALGSLRNALSDCR